MNLMHAEKMRGRHPHPFGHPAAIFRDISGVVVGAEAAIEASVDATGNAALAAKESVTQAGNGREQRRCRGHARGRPDRREHTRG